MPLKTTELVLVHRQRVTGLIRKCVEAAAPAPQPEPQAPAAHPEAEAKPAGGAERQRERHDQQALSSRDSGHRTRHCGRPLRHTRIPDALQLPPGGAHLARRLVSYLLDAWGRPYTSTTNETLTLITAELVANAVRHGRVPGWDFEVRLVATVELLRVEVFDTRAERVPLLSLQEPHGDTESGRGLMLVAAPTDRWGADSAAFMREPGVDVVWQVGHPDYAGPTVIKSQPGEPGIF
ncbi:hypothetical protein BX281_1619 [Streptomyces sp. Ag82_O1-15]|nr:hypothetical protein BX281_1619 [Streptomyces sp. Ag82_O1-15]